VATADATTNQASATFTGAYIRADNAGTKYSLRLVDGSEGTGKFLKSVTSIGQANWAALAITDITASLGASLQVVRMNAAATALEYATLSVASTNLGNANLTADAAERTYTLFGNTASDKLIFQNLASEDILTLYGNGSIDLRVLDSSGIFNLFNQNRPFLRAYPTDHAMRFYDSLGSYTLIANANTQTYQAFGASAGFGTNNIILRNDSTVNSFFSMSSSGVVNIRFDSAANNFFMQNTRIGGLYTDSFLSKFGVQGSGSTSATTTALFQNSSSVSALKVKDDGYCILKANNAAIASGDLANNEMSFYIDEATNHCVVKVKYSSGTVKTGTFNLT
jgi:hypothetical protein